MKKTQKDYRCYLVEVVVETWSHYLTYEGDQLEADTSMAGWFSSLDEAKEAVKTAKGNGVIGEDDTVTVQVYHSPPIAEPAGEHELTN